jgi:hypothetical protein
MTTSAPLQHGTVTVGTTAQTLLITPVGVRRALVTIRNNHASNIVYVGDGTVTASGSTQGIAIPASSTLQLEFASGTTITVIASGASTTVSYLWTAGN